MRGYETRAMSAMRGYETRKAASDDQVAHKGFDALTREETQQLLEFFMYRLGSDLREKLAASLPQAYNSWCGRDVVKVVGATDPTREWKAKPDA